MKVQLSPGDPLMMALFGYLGSNVSIWWLLMIPLIIAGWFIHPRWNNQDGFKFWR